MNRYTSSLAKSVLALSLVVPALSPVVVEPAYAQTAQSSISVIIDGKKQSYEQPPVIVNYRLHVPMRSLFEALGAKVEWDASTQTVIATKGSIKIEMPLNGTVVRLNDFPHSQDQKPVLVNNRVMVPLRLISEIMGADVRWDDPNQVVTINTDGVKLFEAIENENIAQLEQLLTRGVNPNSRAYFNKPAIKYAFKNYKWEVARVLLTHGADRGAELLMDLASEGQIEAIKFYFDYRVDLKEPFEIHELALYLAATSNQTEMVKTLLELYPDLKKPENLSSKPNEHMKEETMSVTDHAITRHNQEMLEAFLQAGAHASLFEPASQNDMSILRPLLAHGADPDLQDEQGWTALMMAAELGNTAAVQTLLDANADPNLSNKGGATALMIAEAHGNTETTQLLEAAGATRNKIQADKRALTREYSKKIAQMLDSWTPLMKATFLGKTDEVRSLLAAGADPNEFFTGDYTFYSALFMNGTINQETFKALATAPNDFKTKIERGNFPLYLAVRNGNVELARFVLEKETSAPDHDYLMMAANQNHLEMLELLLQHGATPLSTKEAEENHIFFADLTDGHVQAKRLLLSAFEPTQQVREANSALMKAINLGNTEMIKMLLDLGADLNHVSETGQTPLQLAKTIGFPAVIAVLEQAEATK